MKLVTIEWSAVIIAWAIGMGLSSAAADSIATFDDLTLPHGSYWNGSNGAGGFNSGGLHFNNTYDQTYGSWEGWAYSDMSDTTTPGYGNQYSAMPGGGYGGSANYGVAYQGFSDPPAVSFSAPAPVLGAWFTNTTYAYLSMRDGDSFAKKFGGPTGNDADWLRLTITGKNSAGQVTGTKDFYLADYRFADNTKDYLTRNWTWVDLTGLGGNVRSLEFGLSSSDVGSWGMNTPAYFAMDNLTVIPEPEAIWLLLSAAGVLALEFVRRTRRVGSSHAGLS